MINMQTIKPYQQLLTVELKDGTILNTDKKLDDLHKFLADAGDFIKMDWVIFGRYEFKKAYERKVDTLESFILSQPKDIRDKINARNKQKYERIGRKFETIEEIQNFMDTI